MILNWLLKDLKYFLDTKNNLPHGLLITGASGIGKSWFSLNLAQGLLCETPLAARDHGLACGHCQACHWLSQGSHPDLRRLMPAGFDPTYDPSYVAPIVPAEVDVAEDGAEKDAEKKKSQEISIEQIRVMTRFLSVGGHRGGIRVVLIDPATSLNNFSANAFLKTLEEPLGSTLIILLATRASQISATLRSRCVVHPLTVPTIEDARAFVQENASGMSQDAIDQALQMAGGMPLRALALAQGQESAGYRLALDALSALPDTGWLQASDQVSQLGAPLWVSVLQYWVADLARVVQGAEPARFKSRKVALEKLAKSPKLQPQALMQFVQSLDHERRWARHPLNPKLYAEQILMRYCQLF
jgi:DNA polymerase III subunit delta'